MATLDTLIARNGTYVRDQFSGPLELRPRLRATIIGCLDPRVDPAHIIGLEPGDAPVIRNIGGRVTPAVLDILDLLALGFPALAAPVGDADRGDLVVLHHTQCGITRMQGHPHQLAASFGIDVSDLPSKSVGDPTGSLAVDVAILRAHPGVAQAYRITGMRFDVSTGLLDIVVPDPTAA